MHIEIHGLNDGKTLNLPISAEALAMVRPGYRPGGLAPADVLKILFAAAITAMEPHRKAGGEAARCADIATTRIEEAAMWSTKAATTES
ncbi:MAG: hypothetical protein JO055_03895 [Alphaproteobacteria bacterium]|nr:hypothetical protein [Alphaproteobacteria bacterium]